MQKSVNSDDETRLR